jgi:hypothetical protein
VDVYDLRAATPAARLERAAPERGRPTATHRPTHADIDPPTAAPPIVDKCFATLPGTSAGGGEAPDVSGVNVLGLVCG